MDVRYLEMDQMIRAQGGRIVSHIRDKYVVELDSVIYNCTRKDIIRGKWKTKNIKQLEQLAYDKAGIAGSSILVYSVKKNMQVKCICGVIFYIKVADYIRTSGRCKECILLYNIDQVRSRANKWDYEITSDSIVPKQRKIYMICKRCGMLQHNRIDHILRCRTRPTCNGCNSDREDACRLVFEEIFRVKFPNCKPDWLINPKTGNKLELDGYSVEVGVAFEYNGPHHYSPSWNRDIKGTRRRDRMKGRICEDNNVLLITIPYTAIDLEEYIRDKLRSAL